MNRRSTLVLFLFAVLSIIHISGQVLELRPLVVLTKPFLVSLLALFFFFEVQPFRGRFPVLIFLGLLLSVAGDIFLLFQGSSYFLMGLSSFLLAHICYLGAFLSIGSASSGNWLARRPFTVLGLLLYLGIFASWLWGGLPLELRIPVVTYAAVITSMALSCVNLSGVLPAPVFRRLFPGVLLFLLSDSLLATDRFMSEHIKLPFAGVLIMASYLAAQYLIATSCAAVLRTKPIVAGPV